MGKRMLGSVLLLATLALTLIVGDVLVLVAQDPPAPSPPSPPSQTQPQPAQKTASPTEQTDLSGTYAGTFKCEALGLSGDTTLTITGNQFTTADGKTGRIVASTTHGYTAVALQAGDVATGPTATTAAAPQIVSMRARKSGDRLTLTLVPGAIMECSFTPARNVARGRRSRQRTPAATGTEVSNPATAPVTVPAEPSQPMPEPSQTPAPSPIPTPSPEPAPTPVPVPSPSPSPQPTPVPTPSGTPAPPEPSPTPSPTPTPSPSPRPRG